MQESGNDARTAMPLSEHLTELAKRMKVVLYVLVASTLVFMVLPSNLDFFRNPLEFYDPLVALVLRVIRTRVLPPEVQLIGYQVTGPINLYVMASFVFAVAVTIPVFAYELYRYIDPALYSHEREAVYPFVLSFTALFVTGAAFGFLVLLPVTMWALFQFFPTVGAEQIISVTDFYNTVFVSTVLCGLTFTWPVFFILLVRFGIAQTSMISKNRRYVYGALIIGVMLITVDGGPIADSMLLIPLIILTEAAVYFGRRYEKSETIPRRAVVGYNRCRFCGTDLKPRTAICSKCGRSQY